MHDLRATERRKERWLHIRLDWRYHVMKLLHENEFDRTYGMSHDVFQELVHILSHIITQRTRMSRCPQPISVETIVAVAMRCLRGGQVNDIKMFMVFPELKHTTVGTVSLTQ